MSRRGWLLFAAMSVIWGIPYLLIKVAVGGVPVPVLVLARVSIGAALLVPIAVRRRQLGSLRPHWRWLAAFAGVEIILPWFLLSAAETRLSSSLSGLLIASVPILVALLARLTGGSERLSAARWAGLLVGLGGVALLVGPGVAGGSTGSVAEVLLVAVCYATGPLIASRRLGGLPSLGMTAVCLAFASVVYAPAAALDWPAAMPSAQVLGALAGLAVVCTALAFLLFFRLIAEAGPSRASVITYINPAVAVALGVSILGEQLTPAMVVAFALILAGSVLATRPGRRGERAAALPALSPRRGVCGADRLAQVIDLKAARQDASRYRAALARRGAAEDFDVLLAADATWREHTERAEGLRALQKKLSRGKPDAGQLAELRRLAAELAEATEEQAHAARERDQLLGRIPNLPDPAAADGMDEQDAQLVRGWGEPPRFSFEPRDALDLGSPRGWIDMARGARLSGSRFAYRIGDVALAEMALYRYVIDKLAGAGFLVVLPPVLVGERAMYGTGFLPTEASNLYHLEKDDLYLTGTSEVALAGIHADERLEENQLPARYAALTTNFRREAGAAGKDTRGMFRVHQFDKVEMYVYCLPEQSAQMHEQLLSYEEEIARDLGLPHRVMNIAVGDLGAPAAKKYDIEAWFPTQRRYREITSCSNTTDYQARRLNIRFRRGGRLEFAHTLNGTGATARALLAVMENFQDEGGTVAVPGVLRRFGAPATLGRAR